MVRLSTRERQLLTLVARGLTDPQIAAELELSEAYVHARISRAIKGNAVRSRAQLVAEAIRCGALARSPAMLARRELLAWNAAYGVDVVRPSVL